MLLLALQVACGGCLIGKAPDITGVEDGNQAAVTADKAAGSQLTLCMAQQRW